MQNKSFQVKQRLFINLIYLNYNLSFMCLRAAQHRNILHTLLYIDVYRLQLSFI